MEAQDERAVHSTSPPSPGALTYLSVIELADEQAEYCGLVLAGLGAEVIKVEPPGGGPTRRIGPFYEDRDDPERSLFFWQYNRGKRSLMLDLHQQADCDQFRALVATADVLLESTPRGELDGFRRGRSRANALWHASPFLLARVAPCRLIGLFDEDECGSLHNGSARANEGDLDIFHLAFPRTA
jgi:crotonobetainyl-CoA:carnitine CoA-transferase CaiB-like acyl-CoA transferase